jgi:hypothetical protein
MAHIDQEYFPENGVLYIVNVPWLFKAAWKIISPWVREESKNKVKILYKDYKEVLKADLGEEVLPDFLGGTSNFRDSAEERYYLELISTSKTS